MGSGGQLLLKSDRDAHGALEVFRDAIEEANARFGELEQYELWIRINAPVPTPNGPLALVTECEPSKALPLMLDTIARSLEQAGLSGKLAPATPPTATIFNKVSVPALGAIVTLPIDEKALIESYDPWVKSPSRLEWLVGSVVTREVIDDVLDWVLGIGGEVEATVGADRVRLDTSGAKTFVRDALPVEHMLSVACTPDEERRRVVKFRQFGCVAIASYDPSIDRTQHLSGLVEVLRAIAPNTNCALVRELTARGGDRESLRSSPPKSELVEAVGNGFWALAHLESDYLYDACVAQVVTTSQLSKTHDLSPERWTVEDLGNGRHLVVHRQPELWFDEDPTPLSKRVGPRISPVDDLVLQQARADFGDAIMTPRTLEEHPPNLPHDELVRAFGNFGLTPRG